MISNISTALTEMQQHRATRTLFSEVLIYRSMDRSEIRQRLRRSAFQRLRTRFASNVDMAEVLGEGFSPSYVSQLLNGHRGIGDDVATKIEDRLGLTGGYLDQPPNEADAPDADILPPPDTIEALLARLKTATDPLPPAVRRAATDMIKDYLDSREAEEATETAKAIGAIVKTSSGKK